MTSYINNIFFNEKEWYLYIKNRHGDILKVKRYKGGGVEKENIINFSDLYFFLSKYVHSNGHIV